MVIGTALGFSDVATIALAVALAFVFGYALTSLPLLRPGMALAAVVPIALATDTFSHRDDGGGRQRDHAAGARRARGGPRRRALLGRLSVALVIAGASRCR